MRWSRPSTTWPPVRTADMPKKPKTAATERPHRAKVAVKSAVAKPARALTGAAKAIAEVDTLTWTGQPQAAIARATTILDTGSLTADQQAHLLDLRAENHFVRGDMAGCAADTDALAGMAKRKRGPVI